MQAVAVIGASDAPRSVGATMLHNLVQGKFADVIMPVNPKHVELVDGKARLSLRVFDSSIATFSFEG